MRRPQAKVSETSCCQIEPFQDCKGVRTYRILPGLTTQHIDSLSMRNISRSPIPLRDKRLITWEYKRNLIPPIELLNSTDMDLTDVLRLLVHLLKKNENLSREKRDGIIWYNFGTFKVKTII